MASAKRLEDLNAYLSEGIHSVDGWCIPQLWYSIWPLAQLIGDAPIAEIGVFEGKFLIGLAKTFGTGPTNKATAIDVFDMQQFNLDGAGVGKVDALRRNLDRLSVGADNVHMVPADSLSLRPQDAETFLKRTGPAGFFSVDGCHEVVHTINDIEFAMQVTANNGIIAVDDYTNPNWPGVQEAIARMYLLRSYSFVPLAVTSNKMLLCSYSYHSTYLDAIHAYIAQTLPNTRMKKVMRFGFDTLTVQPNLQTWTNLA